VLVCGQDFTIGGVTNDFLYGSESCGEAFAGLVDGVGVGSVDSSLEFLEWLEQFGVEECEDAVDVELPGE